MSGKGTVLKPDGEVFVVNKTQYLGLAKLLQLLYNQKENMKKICILLATVFLFACNDNAENHSTDLDRTKNNDTSVVPVDSANTLPIDTADTTHLNP